MMKKFSTLIMMVVLGANLTASAQAFTEGQSSVSLGYGFGNLSQSLFKAYESLPDFNYKGAGPLFLKYEYGISENIGVGVNVAYIGAKVTWTDEFIEVEPGVPLRQETSWTSYSILARMNYHIPVGSTDKFDPYFGVGIGYRSGKWKASDNDPDFDWGVELDSPFILGMEMTGGARYLFTENIGVYGEVGLAKGLLQIGAVGRF